MLKEATIELAPKGVKKRIGVPCEIIDCDCDVVAKDNGTIVGVKAEFFCASERVIVLDGEPALESG